MHFVLPIKHQIYNLPDHYLATILILWLTLFIFLTVFTVFDPYGSHNLDISALKVVSWLESHEGVATNPQKPVRTNYFLCNAMSVVRIGVFFFLLGLKIILAKTSIPFWLHSRIGKSFRKIESNL